MEKHDATAPMMPRKRGPRPIRCDLDGPKPALIRMETCLDLIAQLLGYRWSYATFRRLVEADAIPSRWDPAVDPKDRRFRHRRYEWEAVKAALLERAGQ